MNMMVGLVGKSGQFLLFDDEESLTFWVEYFCGKDILSYLFKKKICFFGCDHEV